MINNLIHQAPAETTNYMIAGYLVIFGIMLIYIMSLIIRSRNLQRDLDTLSQMEQEDK